MLIGTMKGRSRTAVFMLMLGLLTPWLWSGSANPQFRRLGEAEGLTQGNVLEIIMDDRGMVWMATQLGIVRFDGYTSHTFEVQTDDPFHPSKGNPLRLFEDSSGRIWIGYRNGIEIYDPATARFTALAHPSLQNALIRDFQESDSGIWIGTEEGLFFKPHDSSEIATIDLGDKRQIRDLQIQDQTLWIGLNGSLWRINTGQPQSEPTKVSDTGAPVITLDAQGSIWTAGPSKGLTRHDLQGNPEETFPWPERWSWNTVELKFLLEVNGVMWIGSNAGLARRDVSGAWNKYQHAPDNPNTLSSDIISNGMLDPSGVMWFATYGGVNTWDTHRFSGFGHFNQNTTDAIPLGNNSIFSFAEARDQKVWIGTKTGISLWNRATGKMENAPGITDNQTLNQNTITALLEDETHLWVGTPGRGLYKVDPASGEMLKIPGGKRDAKTLSTNAITQILPDNNRLILGLFGGGINILEKESGDVTRFEFEEGNPRSLSSNGPISLAKSGSDLWAGTYRTGLNHLNLETGQVTRFRADEADPNSIKGDSIYSLLLHSSGDLYVGSSVFQRHRPGSGEAVFSSPVGEQLGTIYSLREDRTGKIWISTPKGVYRFHPSISNLDVYVLDLFDQPDFNSGASLITSDGIILFGGNNGFNTINPENIKINPFPPRSAVVDFQVMNVSQRFDVKKSDSILRQPLAYTDTVRLNHKQVIFSFEFSALHYSDPDKNTYAHKLEGLDEDWVYGDAKKRFASYTTLKPGDYTFRVKAANPDGVWEDEGASIQIEILPAPWKTWWAYTLYALTALALILGYIRYQALQIREKQRVIQQLKQVDKLKDDFLANTSHELRTPLNGIIGLTESLLDGVAGPVNQTMGKNLEMVVSGGRRLATLVDDILDFSKLKNSSLDLNRKPVDLYTVIDVVMALSKPLVGGKDIELINEVPKDLAALNADENRLLQIAHNLIGNAVKFTENGQVRVSALLGDHMITVYVEDTGIGIPADQLERIFAQFVQVEDADQALGGTGLGLAITKHLVELHGGEIKVISAPGEGSTFSFTMPRCEEAAKPELSKTALVRPSLRNVLTDADDGLSIEPIPTMEMEKPELSEAFHILIVDDEPINRQVLSNHLSNRNYIIHEASGGQEALRMLMTLERVDLVLLDIMMPHMSGYHVCRELRKRMPIHELPIIFLTAKTQLSDLVNGFECGANDYLTKPITKLELLSRVETHLRLLDITRTLEERVAERTGELAGRNDELETLDRIVENINREVILQRVLQTVLDQGSTLFPRSEGGVFYLLREKEGAFVPAAITGAHPEAPSGTLSRDQLMARYTQDAERLGRDVYLIRDGDEHHPGSCLSMAVIRDDKLEGFLILSNHGDSGAFDRSDLRMLDRFRQHAVSAVIKARMMEELQIKNEQILETQQQLAQKEKMASLGILTAGVAHEIRNPLNFINNFSKITSDFAEEIDALVEPLADKTLDQETYLDLRDIASQIKQNGAVINKHGQRADHIVRSMMEFTRGKKSVRRPTEINAFVQEHVEMAVNGANLDQDAKGILLDLNLQEDLGTHAVAADSLGRVMINLVNNALEVVLDRALTSGPSFVGKIWVTTRDLTDSLQIEIKDNGGGIDPEIQKKIFTPFFTTKTSQDNIGLGLAISYDIVTREHGGKLECESQDGTTCFTLTIPKNAETPPADLKN